MAAELFPFKYFDPLRGRWLQARYRATREAIAKGYEKWQITGPGWTPPDVGAAWGSLARSPASSDGL